MKIIVISFFLIGFTSCYTGKNILHLNPTYDSIIKANEISFFGAFEHKSTDKKKNLTLLYEKNGLKFIAVGLNKKINENRLYKIDFISDSLTMLSQDSYSKYHMEDSLIFTKDECVFKRAFYSVEGYLISAKTPFMIDYVRFFFTKEHLIRFTERYYQTKETLDNVALKEYYSSKKILDVSKAYDYAETKFENINDEKMLFFTSYIAR